MPSVPSSTPSASSFLAVSDQRILANAAATISVTLLDQDGIAVDAAGAVTVEVTRDDGTILIPAGTAATHGGAGSGIYSIGLTAAQSSVLDLLTAQWTDQTAGTVTITHVDVVGGYHVSIAALRAQPNLSDSSRFPNSKLIDARRCFETLAEDFIGVAFVPRYRRVTVWGGGSDTIQVPDRYIRQLRSIRFGTVSLADSALQNTVATADGTIQRYWPYLTNGTDDSWGAWGQIFPNKTRITVAYEYGLDRPPTDLAEQALIAIRSTLLSDYTGRPMLSISDGAGGTTRFAMPGPNRPTGIPDVDEVLVRLRDRYATNHVGSIQVG